MHKLYLSIIALISVIFLVTIFYTKDDGSPNTQKEAEPAATNQEETEPEVTDQEDESSSRTASIIDPGAFEEYFSGVEAEEINLEGSEGVSIKTEEIPEERHKQVAAGLLIEAKKYINSNGEWVLPPGKEEPNINPPTDDQLRGLMELKDNELATSIKQISVILQDANDLIDDESINDQIERLREKLVAIEIYEKETFYTFSLAYEEYKTCVQFVHSMTKDIEGM
ncbi:hypothetical protein SAMN04487936_11192 [Halobacillus dabanensis]|uniref:Uncharacterized protein n=1 Tax=Halobacillus dabanensis TaxID=240302 RepID=A0A1I3YPP8_HALDA|nr:hypothetical protein [Halobacillus dabanensis]SFK33241.1 hypothetical protein SAMN04487936_11192 [Halobacillus dabanensis]